MCEHSLPYNPAHNVLQCHAEAGCRHPGPAFQFHDVNLLCQWVLWLLIHWLWLGQEAEKLRKADKLLEQLYFRALHHDRAWARRAGSSPQPTVMHVPEPGTLEPAR